MNKPSAFLLLIAALILSACSGNAANTASPTGNSPGGGPTGALSAPLQVALGTIKLDGTKDAVTADQAKELLPLWETLQVLETSDTAATEEKDALVAQIQETMTQQQTQAISALGLTRQDMFSIMQSQAQTFGGTQNNGTTRRSGASGTGGRNFGGGNGGGGGFFVGGGGPPPDAGGGGLAGGGNFTGQGSRSQSNSSTNSTGNSNRQFTTDPNRIPAPLFQAVIAYLKTKTGT
jgi:hypothetical protein